MNFKHKLLEGYTVSVMLEEEHLEDSGRLSLKQLSSIKSSSFLIWEGIPFPRDFKRSRVKLVALLLNLEFSIMTNYVCISRRKHKYRNYERINFHKCWGGFTNGLCLSAIENWLSCFYLMEDEFITVAMQI